VTDILAIGPHPDDLELSCGGWLALAVERGQTVVMLDLSRGELSTNGTPSIRGQEARTAADILGVKDRRNAELPDGSIASTDPDHVDAVVACLRACRPALVLAPWVQERHPDHSEAGLLVQRAVFKAGLRRHQPHLGEAHRVQRLIHYPQRTEVRPDFVVDTSATFAKKQQAIAAHASQFGDGTHTLINSGLGLGVWQTRDRYWGASIGAEFGEPYVLGVPVPIHDPVEHFAAHPARPVWTPLR
jgi:N-acetylglucosamine malate deacetylase 1